MDARDDGEVSKLSPGRSPRGQAAAPVSSLNKACLHALDKCAIDTPLSETVLPLMRNCFFGGAAHAVLLLQKGHGDQLASDIASFLMEERFSSGKSGNCDDGLAFQSSSNRRSSRSALRKTAAGIISMSTGSTTEFRNPFKPSVGSEIDKGEGFR